MQRLAHIDSGCVWGHWLAARVPAGWAASAVCSALGCSTEYRGWIVDRGSELTISDGADRGGAKPTVPES